MLKTLKLHLEELPVLEDWGIKHKRAKIKQQMCKIKLTSGKIKPVRSPKIEFPIGDNVDTVTDPD
jgi:hypothetical protein